MAVSTAVGGYVLSMGITVIRIAMLIRLGMAVILGMAIDLWVRAVIGGRAGGPCLTAKEKDENQADENSQLTKSRSYPVQSHCPDTSWLDEKSLQIFYSQNR
jgi:hypothetical protein